MCCNHKSVDLSLLNDVLEHYADVKGSLITILQKTQDIYGYVPIDAVYHIAERTGLTPAKIMGVATFYSQFALNPRGDVAVAVCLGTACYVKGSGDIYDKFGEILGLVGGGTSPDGKWSLEATRCIGACGLAPVLTVNGTVYGRLTAADVQGIVDQYK